METAEDLALIRSDVQTNGHVNGAVSSTDLAEDALQMRWGSVSSTLTYRQRVLKRAFDLIITVPALLVALPVFLVIAVAIYLESGGPILIRQARIGEGGTLFPMQKFRTMVPDSERRRRQVPIDFRDRRKAFKTRKDPRVTRVGRFLRRTSLDELPQLINVLVGDMSLVGPRPEVIEIALDYEPWQWKRWGVPQGLTGLWQIRGRSHRPTQVKCLDDLEYIYDYSLWLDLKILVQTIIPVIRGRGAF